MKYRFLKIIKLSASLLKSRSGQTLVEYALILAFISIVAISVLINFGSQALALYSSIDSRVSYASTYH